MKMKKFYPCGEKAEGMVIPPVVKAYDPKKNTGKKRLPNVVRKSSSQYE